MDKIINLEEKNYIINWISLNHDKFIKNIIGENRKYLKLSKNSPKIFFDIKKRIIKNEKIDKWENEVILGDMITYQSTDGFIHKHVDPSPGGKKHIRFNLILSKPIDGGKTFYANKLIEYEEGDYLICDTSKIHYTTPVIGYKPRIAISYGILV